MQGQITNAGEHACLERARLARDARFDGRFFIAVRTTGIFCRPVCPVRMPRAENVTFFRYAAAALQAGFRPCLRCRPEAAPGSPAWAGTEATVRRALRMIEAGALDEQDTAGLAEQLGVGPRHLGRLFRQHVGVSPLRVAAAQRLLFARRLLVATSLPMADVAMAAGFRSLRRFNGAIREAWGIAPTALRRGGVAGGTASGEVRLGVACIGSRPGLVEVAPTEGGGLEVRVQAEATSLLGLLARVRGVFDTDASPDDVAQCLRADPVLRRSLATAPGLRVPGAFDAFEVAVRAIVGQQVSVAAASTIMGRIAALGPALDEGFGVDGSAGDCAGAGGLCRAFPTPEVVAELPASFFPMPGKRAQAILELARRCARGDVRFDAEAGALKDTLQGIAGIGPWTAGYVSMRVARSPDELLLEDLVLRRALERFYPEVPRRRHGELAERWRPFRSYAQMHLWRLAGGAG